MAVFYGKSSAEFYCVLLSETGRFWKGCLKGPGRDREWFVGYHSCSFILLKNVEKIFYLHFVGNRCSPDKGPLIEHIFSIEKTHHFIPLRILISHIFKAHFPTVFNAFYTHTTIHSILFKHFFHWSVVNEFGYFSTSKEFGVFMDNTKIGVQNFEFFQHLEIFNGGFIRKKKLQDFADLTGSIL